jgi:hypothetical protein
VAIVDVIMPALLATPPTWNKTKILELEEEANCARDILFFFYKLVLIINFKTFTQSVCHGQNVNTFTLREEQSEG